MNAIEPYSYIQPHKHEDPDKREVFTVLRGRLLVVEFDNHGEIAGHMIVDPKQGSFGAEIAERIYHAIYALEPGTIVYEVKDGPYSPIDDKNFASWAPKEGATETTEYIQDIFRRLRIELV